MVENPDQRIKKLEEEKERLRVALRESQEENEILVELFSTDGEKWDPEGYVHHIVDQYGQIGELKSQVDILTEEIRQAQQGSYNLSAYMGKRIYVIGIRSLNTQRKLAEKLKPQKITFLEGFEYDVNEINGSANDYDVIIYVTAGIKTHKIDDKLNSYLKDKSRVIRIPNSVNYSLILQTLAEQSQRFT